MIEAFFAHIEHLLLTKPEWFMQINAWTLIGSAMLIGVLICRDYFLRPFLPALLAAVVAATFFLHAMWLLGAWMPNAAGYPWPRLSSDVGVFVFLAWRTAVLLIESARHRRAINRRLAVRRS